MAKQQPANKPAEPKASRPHMPGYGIPKTKAGLLPWSWARERLTRAHNYWAGTSRPDGRPHAMAVWGAWLDEMFLFSTGRDSCKMRNLAANPAIVVHTDRADEAVIVEGAAAELADRALRKRFVAVYQKKYGYNVEQIPGSVIYAVRPRVAFGFIEEEEQFVTTATRWTFE